MQLSSKTISCVLWLWLTLVALPVQALDSGVESLRQTGKAFAAVARAVSPSVVFIQVEGKAPTGAGVPFSAPFGDAWPFGDDLFKRFFGAPLPGAPGTPQPEAPRGGQAVIGQGSGFVFRSEKGLLSGRAYIMTNNHVVEGADRIRVRLQDGREFKASITGRDPQSDVAVIEVKASDLPALPLADASKLEVGEWVVAIGNPFGLSHTLTVGVVSAKGRTSVGINDYEDFIQTDAAINPGNSGGPLVNLDGEVVGMNTAIFSRSGGYMGIGFAIPSNLAQAIATQLIEHGEVTRGYLGIVIQQLTPDLAESFGLGSSRGILVSQVSAGSPGEKAGLRQGDVIVSFAGEGVDDVGSFRNRVSLTPPGTEETLTILRDGKRKKLQVTIGKLSRDKQIAQGSARSAEEIGLTVQTLTPRLAEQFGVPAGEGVVVTNVQPGSIAALAGIEAGSVILQVDRRQVKSASEFQRMIRESSRRKQVLLLVRKGDMQRYLVLRW